MLKKFKTLKKMFKQFFLN